MAKVKPRVKLPKKAAKDGTDARLRQQVTEISDRLNSLAGEQGFDFNQIIGSTTSTIPCRSGSPCHCDTLS